MALPKLNHPIYEVKLKSIQKPVRFRPFLVKEEKILLMTKESDDIEEVRKAIIQMLSNCCLDDIDIEHLPLYDVEMFFIHLRAKSVGENLKLKINCQNKLSDGTVCGSNSDYIIDLNNVKYLNSQGLVDDKTIDSRIKISEDIGIKLKYPDINIMMRLPIDYDFLIKLIIDNIEYVYDADSIYKDFSKEEMLDFLNGLELSVLEKIGDFFSTMPVVSLVDKLTCEKCGYEHKIKAENILSFFV